MPFKSVKQERFMWARHPEIARRWAKKYGSLLHKLAKRLKKRKKRRKHRRR